MATSNPLLGGCGPGATGFTVTPNTTAAYCVLRPSQFIYPQMVQCCSERYSAMAPVETEDDCFPWCRLVINDGDPQKEFRRAVDRFNDCLTSGDGAVNDSALAGMVCSPGASGGERNSSSAASTSSAAGKTVALTMGLLCAGVVLSIY